MLPPVARIPCQLIHTGLPTSSETKCHTVSDFEIEFRAETIGIRTQDFHSGCNTDSDLGIESNSRQILQVNLHFTRNTFTITLRWTEYYYL